MSIQSTQTYTDLQKLRQLIDDLGSVVDRQHQTVIGSQSQIMMRSSYELLNLLTPVKNTLQELEQRVQAQERERQQLRALQEVGAVINSSLDLSTVLNTVMDTIISLTGAERGFLMLINENTGDLEVEVARNINRETIADESSFAISRSIVESVVETGEPVVTTNAQADPRFAAQESIISYNLRSILCVPLETREVIIGAIYSDNRIAAGIFDDTDRDLLAAFANQAAVAIENARLFNQIRTQLDDITEMKNLMDDVFTSIPSGVITIDSNDQISLYNRSAEQILGIPETHVVDQGYRSVLSSVIGELEDLVEFVKDNGGQFNNEVDIVVRKRPGVTTLSMIGSPLRDMQQEPLGVTVVLNDVSETKRLESVRRYLPPALVDQVRDVDAAQRPQRQSISILFADIRGFSTLSEHMDPEKLIQILNVYFTVSAQAITKYEGVIDKFMGDAVMALFNTPLNPQKYHIERAIKAALFMQMELRKLHETVPEDKQLFFGIGIHMGDAVVGNVGSDFRKDYSAIGDTVNLSKRLQEMASGNQILISSDVYEKVKDWVQVIKLDPVRVKGRQALEQVYELTGVVDGIEL